MGSLVDVIYYFFVSVSERKYMHVGAENRCAVKIHLKKLY